MNKQILRWRLTLARFKAKSEWNRRRDFPIHQIYLRENMIYFHLPKVAGNAIVNALWGSVESQHRSAIEYRLIFGNKFFEKAFKFSFWRDPVDRFFSAYRFLSDGGMNASDAKISDKFNIKNLSFTQFVALFLETSELQQYYHFQPQFHFLWDEVSGKVACDFLGNYSFLDRDYKNLQKIVKYGKDLKRVNESRRPKYYREVDSISVKRLKDYYSMDYEIAPSG